MNMPAYNKPLPAPDPDSAPFWEGTRAHELRLQRCDDCGTHRYPAGPHCPACRSTRATWIRASGRGKVYSWIVVVHPVPKEVYHQEVPYAVALIDLAEGVRMASNIVGCDPRAITADMPVEVVFDAVTADVTLPKFKQA